jgi:hypothetical protein
LACHLFFDNIPLDQNYRIFVHEDGTWNVKGRFRDAVEDDEEVTWANDNGQLVLSVCAEGKDSFAVPSAAGSAPHAPVSEAIGQTGNLSRNELIALLNIPEHLAKSIKGAGLRVNFAKYKACLTAQETLDQKIKEGSWPDGVKKPTSAMIIQLFVSKSYWHSYMTPAFQDISHYPLLKEWLEGLEGGPSDADVWGVEQTSYGFNDLQREKERRKQQTKSKGKATKKDTGSVPQGEQKKKKKKGGK